MTTQLSTKLAALGVALMVNALMIGGVAVLFNGHLRHTLPVPSLAGAAPSSVHGGPATVAPATI